MIIKIVKIYLGLSLVLFWVLWGQFIFGQFLGPTFISQDLQAPSYVFSSNHRVLIYCLQSKAVPSVIASSVYWSLQCLVSTLTQRGWWRTLFFFFQAHLFSCAEGRQGGMLQTNNTAVCSQCLIHTGSAPPTPSPPPQLTGRVASLPTLLRLQAAPPGTIRGRPWAA